VVLSQFDFVNVVAADRDLVLTNLQDHNCRLEPRESDLAWYCDLDDGTPTSNENDPASYVRWVCPTLRIGGSVTQTDAQLLDVRRSGPQSDLGKLIKGFGRLVGRASRATPVDDDDVPFVYTDPGGILDAGLRQRIENWPPAPHGDGVTRPAELWSIRYTHEGLIVASVSWWNSAPALDHQIGLALDLAHRLMGQP
jgi:hypothetical protein